MKVMKFGGSSVGSPERILGILNILKSYYNKGDKFTVVFSAFGGITDQLIEMAKAASNGHEEEYLALFDKFSSRTFNTVNSILTGAHKKDATESLKKNHDTLRSLLKGIFLVREISKRTMDYVLSFGERNSAFVIYKLLNQHGIKADYLDARKIIITDKNFGSANVNFDVTYKNIKDYYQSHPNIQIVTGFISADKGGLTTTLGRGGSDYTAAIIANGLDAQSLEIWTDVNGVLTADPRRVEKAFTIETLTYAEAMEMSHFGAKVIYPPTLQPVLLKNIPLYIKNTFNPNFIGTVITKDANGNKSPIKGISSISNVSLLTLEGSGLFGVAGIAGRLFSEIAKVGINIILITQGSSEHAISFAVQPSDCNIAKKQIEIAFDYEMKAGIVNPVKVERDLSVLAVIGENMRFQPGISGQLFNAMGHNGINISAIAQGSSELNISLVVDRKDETKALNVLHEAFFLSKTKEINIFIVGVGLIGGRLLKQIRNQATYLREKHAFEINLIGLSNSRKMLFDHDGIQLTDWESSLANSDTIANLPQFINQMIDLNLPNSIFIDNTANELVTTHYEAILKNSISISTPNKIATSSSYEQYKKLKYLAQKNCVKFMYETNVGAGLPVLSTLHDLMKSGDDIIKIEGVLSGSLSYIFNNFTKGSSFSGVVSEAQEKGYTEPDPRIDLNGIDVARKLLILAREAGYETEKDQITIHKFLPQSCQNAKNIPDFFDALKNKDIYFEKLRSEAEKKGKVLRMIAKLNNGVASIGLEAVDKSHPFYGLNGSDNMIIFTTRRYKDRPLVVTGPGAGAAVTAAGVFAEIIKIGEELIN